MRTISDPTALDRDHITRLPGIFSPALPVQHVWRAAFERPVHHLAVLAFHIHIKIDVRIHELHFGNYSGECDGIFLVDLHRESMMRQDWRRSGQQNEGEATNDGRSKSHSYAPTSDCELAFLYNLGLVRSSKSIATCPSLPIPIERPTSNTWVNTSF